jgi:predicted GNAT family acetyltransferase
MAEEAKTVEVVRNEDEGRWEADLGGALALLTYDEREGKLYLLHTEVPPEAEGQGIGGKLVKAALEHARGAGLKVVPFCAFAKAYMQRHKEYDDLRAEEQ